MSKKILILIWLFCSVFFVGSNTSHAQATKALTPLIKVVAGREASKAIAAKAQPIVARLLSLLGTAESARRTGESFEKYKYEDFVLKSLMDQGLEANKSAIYSIYFKTTGGYWSDFFSKPDLFFVVDIEGQGSKLVPQIHYNYQGAAVLDCVISDYVSKGKRVSIRVMDDDSLSDSVWNTILKSRLNYKIGSDLSATRFLSLSSTASGQFVLLEKSQTIDAPDFIAQAEFIVPDSEDGTWATEAKLFDSSGNNVGVLQFVSVWSAPKTLEKQASIVQSSFASMIFWAVVCGCALLWFIASLMNEPGTTQN